MGRRQTIHIPGVSHSAPIPFGARVGHVVYNSGIRGDNERGHGRVERGR